MKTYEQITREHNERINRINSRNYTREVYWARIHKEEERYENELDLLENL